jgi:hypothetical protein
MSAALQTTDLGEAALDFVKAGSARPTLDTTAAVAAPVQSADNQESRPRENGVTPRLPLGDDAEVEPEPGLVSLTVRVPRAVPPGLLLASVDRKLKRQRPWTQQEIVAEALAHWLRKHGYLS